MQKEAVKSIWIITEETPQVPIPNGTRGGGQDVGGLIGGSKQLEASAQVRVSVSAEKLRKEMADFLQVIGDVFDQADQQASSGMQLDEVVLAVEINGEGQVSLLGTGGKVGGKGGLRSVLSARILIDMATNWAIVVGINSYNNLQSLQFAKRDALLMQDLFVKEEGFEAVFLFTDDSPRILASPSSIPSQPTFGNLWRFLRAQFEGKLLEAGDNLWFFFAGHGRRYADRDYLLLSDTDPGDVEHTAIPISYISERLRRCGADNIVLLLDACRDKGTRDGLGIGLERQQGVITFFPCSPNKRAYEIEALQQGSFTYALLEGLRLRSEHNCATVERLDQYLRSRVPEINSQYGYESQTPYAIVEPITKRHLILLPKQAMPSDVTTLKNDALSAEDQGRLALAKQLWIRVQTVSPTDPEAIEATERLAQISLPPLQTLIKPGTRLYTRLCNWSEPELLIA